MKNPKQPLRMSKSNQQLQLQMPMPMGCSYLFTSSSFTLHLPLPLPSYSFHPNKLLSLNTNTSTNHHFLTRATLDASQQTSPNPNPLLLQSNPELEESVKVLKNAAKTRKVAADQILSAFSVIEKAKVDSSAFLETLGGSKSPGKTWMLIFTAEKKLTSGRYFPITAVQRFDAAAKRIENGVYLGPLGSLTFEGGFSWKNRILAFIFERIRIKIGPFNPLEIGLGQKGDREPSTKGDPFFIWFYIDEEIAVARGRSGGTAFWCRCRRVNTT